MIKAKPLVAIAVVAVLGATALAVWLLKAPSFQSQLKEAYWRRSNADSQGAEQIARKLADRLPSLTDEEAREAYLLSGVLHADAKRYKDAAAQLEAALARRPTGELHLTCATFLKLAMSNKELTYGEQRFASQDIQSHLKKAVELDPSLADRVKNFGPIPEPQL